MSCTARCRKNGIAIPDASHVWRKLPYALLLASLFVFGVWPRLLTDKITPDVQKIVTMTQGETVAVGSTRLWRVQFGVPPNWVGTRATVIGHTSSGELRPQSVSGATPKQPAGRGCYTIFSPALRQIIQL